MADNHRLKLLTDRWGGWNEWRRQNPDVRPDLSGADLERQLLIGVDLSGSNLRSAKLNYVDLRGANLSHANLENANLYPVVA